VEVGEWIRRQVWQILPELREKIPTILVFDDASPGVLVGFGSWSHVEAISSSGRAERHIELAWFGVNIRYQGQVTDSNHLCADRILATVLADALNAADSSPDMPITLLCHVDNDHAHAFFERHGFVKVTDAYVARPVGDPERYTRMVLGQPPDDSVTSGQ